MNSEVREYLIAVAREDESTVFYKDLVNDNRLKIDLGTPEGQERLKQMLIEISTYENQHGRPMLTALAINKRDNDQGPGFYELAESFGHGKKSELRKKGWGREEAVRVRVYWKNEDHYNQFAKIDASGKGPNTIGRLFDKLIHAHEFEWAEGWRDIYMAFVADVKRLQKNITANSKLSIDNDKLYENLSKPVRSYESFMLKWLKEKSNGISSRGQSVLSEDNFEVIINDPVFKATAKLVISNPSPATYKRLMSWWYSNEDISNRPLLINRAVAACLTEQLSSTVDNGKFWYVVDILCKKYGFQLDDGSDWNWFTANVELTKWLDVQLKNELNKISSDKTEQQIWRNIFVWLIYERYHGKPIVPINELIRQEPPEDGHIEMPQSNTKFTGRDVDFEAKAKADKELGDAGEELVKLHEIRELEKREMFKHAKLVRIAKTGEGYDVYSFDEKGKEKFIEVKTTTGNWKNRFYLTRHEIKFMQQNKSNYSLYRVYNFDEENNSGEFFELLGNIEQRLIKEPTQFEVVIKRK